jgi:N5-(carboxyethyl)ornithine synthase
LYFESGYGDVLGYCDDDYLVRGANVVTREEAYCQDIVCNLKTPELGERDLLHDEQTLFGWIHAVQGRSIARFLCAKRMTGIAWEDMSENGRHVFWRNNEIAGEAAVYQGFAFLGRLPQECEVAVLGRGNCARGATAALDRLGSRVTVYDRRSIGRFREELGNYTVIVNAVLWDVFSKERLVYRDDLKRMASGSMIIDISCDEGLEIETSRATTIAEPVYTIDGVLHYAVDNAASLFWKSASTQISGALSQYIDALVMEEQSPVVARATIIDKGKILDERIVQYQGLRPDGC